MGRPHPDTINFFYRHAQLLHCDTRSGYYTDRAGPYLFSNPAMYVPRQVAVSDCHDNDAVFDSTCWERLGIPDYLGGVAGWAWNFPKCDMTKQSGVAGERCCLPEEPWSECYLRYGWGSGSNGANCSIINEQTCTWPPNANVTGKS